MRKILFLISLLILCIPQISFARVLFSEVAWMGTASSQFAEWVELFNDGTDPVDLNGAVLYEGGGATPVITLSKTIGAGEYYLVERTTASSPDAVPGFNDDAGSFGGGGLSNSGEFLMLKGSDGAVLDQLNAAVGWPAGDSSTKETMQWNGSVWVTSAPTPRAALPAGAGSTGSPSGSSSSEQSVSSLSSHASTATLAPKLKPREPLSIQAGRDRLGFVGVPLGFEAKGFLGEDAVIKDVSFAWSFGDGGFATGAMVEHAYQFPGEYVVVLNGTRGEDKSTTRLSVKVVAPELSITKVDTGAHPYIEIKNNGGGEINLWKASLRVGAFHFEFPEDTILLPGMKVAFSKEVTGLNPKEGEEVVLFWPGSRVGGAFTIPRLASASTTEELEQVVRNLKAEIAEAERVRVRPPAMVAAPRLSQPILVASSDSVLSKVTENSSASSTHISTTTPRIIAEIPKSKNGGGIFSWPGRALSFVGGLIFGK